MAFDTKRMKTFQWLFDIAEKDRKYCDKYRNLKEIYVYCGSLYATNHIVLAKVDYPEFEHLSDYVWSKVTRFCDSRAILLKEPEIEVLDQQFKNSDIFDRFFTNEFHPLEYAINPMVLKDGLKGFEINGINPVIYTSENMVFLMGHNKDVSIRVCMMGVRI